MVDASNTYSGEHFVKIASVGVEAHVASHANDAMGMITEYILLVGVKVVRFVLGVRLFPDQAAVEVFGNPVKTNTVSCVTSPLWRNEFPSTA